MVPVHECRNRKRGAPKTASVASHKNSPPTMQAQAIDSVDTRRACMRKTMQGASPCDLGLYETCHRQAAARSSVAEIEEPKRAAARLLTPSVRLLLRASVHSMRTTRVTSYTIASLVSLHKNYCKIHYACLYTEEGLHRPSQQAFARRPRRPFSRTGEARGLNSIGGWSSPLRHCKRGHPQEGPEQPRSPSGLGGFARIPQWRGPTPSRSDHTLRWPGGPPARPGSPGPARRALRA